MLSVARATCPCISNARKGTGKLPVLRLPPMDSSAPSFRSHLTLVLCTILHAFTHAYGTLLVPLYLLIVADLKLGAVWKASIIVTIYGFIYCLFSYPAGVLADRLNR